MQLSFVVTYFIVTVVCMIMAVILMKEITPDMGRKREIRCFRRFVFWYLVFVVSNSVWIWIQYGYLRLPGTPFSLVNLLAICLVIYYWFLYIETRINPYRVENRRFALVASIPLAAALALIFSSPVTDLVFYYTPSGEYMHGPMYPVMLALAALYLILATAHIGYHLHHTDSTSERRQYYASMSFWGFPLMAGLIDVIIPNLPVMELSLLLGINIVYVSMQKQQIFYDNMTGLNNRRYAEKYMEGVIMLLSEDKPYYFYIVKLKNLESINREHGYAEGDRALRLAAQILRQSADELHYSVARWGGDEFALIVPERAAVSPEIIIRLILKRLTGSAGIASLPYRIEMEFGYTRCISPMEQFPDIIERAVKARETRTA
ncbi:MAG: GGDEF domain-containing protein [Lachnospiraceae bacterium]|nr:GGDEF domain-containing protein [Lachnospiraceae bacterium]